MKIKLFIAVSLIGMCVLLSSCSTKRHAISQLEKFSYELRDNSAYYNYQDWQLAADQFLRIRQNISRYDYTVEERRYIGELEGNCAGYMADGLKTKVNSIGAELKGILEGIVRSVTGK